MYLHRPLLSRCFALFAACFLLLNAVDALVPGRESGIFDGVIRLHVIADGDGKVEQRVKLLVRDRILAEFSGALSAAGDIRAAADTASKLIPRICETANRVLAENGAPYKARAYLVRERYPTRDYGGISLPSGEYCSLKIVLGEGNGQNWWCVMFPPLCFGASAKALADTAVGERSARVFTKKKYVFRFKLLELFG